MLVGLLVGKGVSGGSVAAGDIVVGAFVGKGDGPGVGADAGARLGVSVKVLDGGSTGVGAGTGKQPHGLGATHGQLEQHGAGLLYAQGHREGLGLRLRLRLRLHGHFLEPRQSQSASLGSRAKPMSAPSSPALMLTSDTCD